MNRQPKFECGRTLHLFRKSNRRGWNPIFKNNWFMFELTPKEVGHYYCVTTAISVLRTPARKVLLVAVRGVQPSLCVRTSIKHRLLPV